MTALRILPLIGFCLPLVMATGCTRTSDGSIVIADPPKLAFGVPAFLRGKQERPVAADPRIAALSTLPPARRVVAAPPPRKRALPRVSAWRVSGVSAPFVRPDPQKPLSCRNAQSRTGRVRVICE